MQNKSNAVFPENQVSQANVSQADVSQIGISQPRVNSEKILAIIERLESTADSILRGVGRRTVVISVFPHNKLNETYRHKNELALIEYGKQMATASYLRDKFGLKRKQENKQENKQETTVAVAA